MKKHYFGDSEGTYRVLDADLDAIGKEIAQRTYPKTKRVEIIWEGHFQLFSLNIFPHPTNWSMAYLGIKMGHDESSMLEWLRTTSSIPKVE